MLYKRLHKKLNNACINFTITDCCYHKVNEILNRVATLPGNLEFDNLGKKKTEKTWNFQ